MLQVPFLFFSTSSPSMRWCNSLPRFFSSLFLSVRSLPLWEGPAFPSVGPKRSSLEGPSFSHWGLVTKFSFLFFSKWVPFDYLPAFLGMDPSHEYQASFGTFFPFFWRVVFFFSELPAHFFRALRLNEFFPLNFDSVCGLAGTFFCCALYNTAISCCRGLFFFLSPPFGACVALCPLRRSFSLVNPFFFSCPPPFLEVSSQ